MSELQNITFSKSQATKFSDLKKEPWEPISLPDDWYKNHEDVDQVWYRSNLTLETLKNDTWSIYLPSVSHNAAVYVNGVWVGQGGFFDDPVSRHHNDPLLFTFAPELLKVGFNQIDIRVKTQFHEQGFLGKIYVGLASDLYNTYQFKHFIRVDLIQWISVAMYLMAIIVFMFWWARPQDKIYGIFALELFFWASHNLNLFVSDIPIPAHHWEAMTMSTLGWTIITMIFFNHRYVGETRAWIEKILLVFAVFGVGLFLLPNVETVLHIGYRIWDGFLIVFGSYAMYHLLKAYWHQGDRDIYLMLLVGVPILVFGLHDILMVNHLGDRLDGLIIQYSVIPAALLFSWFLVRRFVLSVNQAEHLAAHLERRVEENKQQILDQFIKLNEMEKQSLLADERERIMRDMHDGIGGQLISVISLLQEQKGELFKRIREKVQHSLTDLRFVIDSLDPLQNEIPILLGTMRMRLHDQLNAANIELEWAVTDLPDIPDMSPKRSLHIMRIVQEAITNCIKHADCKKMKLATGTVNQENSQVYIDVIDYGQGLDKTSVNKTGSGRGIDNMRYRAKQIGAELSLDSTEKGTRVRLLIALA